MNDQHKDSKEQGSEAHRFVEVAAERNFYENLLDGIADGVYFVDRRRIVRYWNRGAERITGFNRSEVVGKACRDNILMHVDDTGKRLCVAELCPALATILDGQEREAEIYLHHKEGYRVPVLARISPIRDGSGNVAGAAEVFTNNRRGREMTNRIMELERLALIDPLTRIGNRRYAEIHIENAFSQLDRYGWPFGVLFMDVDHFKRVNDSYGHETGDRALQMVAGTLSHNVRGSDVVSRWGGEEFLVLAPHALRDEIGVMGKKILTLIERSSLSVAGGTLGVTVSIGATLARGDDSLESLVGRADHLMYESKRKGRNTLTAED